MWYLQLEKTGAFIFLTFASINKKHIVNVIFFIDAFLTFYL